MNGMSFYAPRRNKISFHEPTEIKKGWGKEIVITNNALYCGKFLVYEQIGATSSAHLHLVKQEHFTCISGLFRFFYWDEKGNKIEKLFKPNEVIEIPNGCPHQLICIEPGTIFEVSTFHSDEDVIRIAPGDSQKQCNA